jgi:membrane associated rhomboid family serine protease/tetratricopeptide (TPR) repeat protein
VDQPPESTTTEEAPGITVDELLAHITPRAWVTPTLAILVLIGFAVELSLGVSFDKPTGGQLLKAGGEFGPAFLEGEWWRALTSMFLHAGPLHLAFNLWAFWSVGKITERIFGNMAFLALYLLSGIGGSLASLAWSPLSVGVGASGAIFGVYGALLAFVALHRGVLPTAYLAGQRNSILGFIGYNVVFGLSQKNTDMAAHIGGLVTGMAAGALLGRDLLEPRARAGARALGAVGLAVLVGLTAIPVRTRIAALPVVRADRDAAEGYMHLQAGEYPQAIDAYTRAIDTGREPSWLANRGLAYLRTDDLEPAEHDVRDADVAKSTPITRSLLCEITARRITKPESAEPAIKACSDAIAAESDPKNRAQLLAMRAVARSEQNHDDESLADAEAALQLDGEEVMARALRAGVYLQRGQIAEAEEDCTRLLAPTPPRIFDLMLCARVARARKDPTAERALLERAVTLAPMDERALVARAWLNQHEGRTAESLADYDRAVAAKPDLAATWNNRAWLRVTMGDFDAALNDAERAVALRPDYGYAHGTRCFALAGLGEIERARADCRRAIELEPGSAIDRGMLAFLEKRYTEARREWQLASEGDPVRATELRPWLAKIPR